MALPSLPRVTGAQAGPCLTACSPRAAIASRRSPRSPGSHVCCLSCFSCNPDAIFFHRLRRELKGRPFCFLEIDSHTADAGIDTRIGAFLDIIEAGGREGHRDGFLEVLQQPDGAGHIDYTGRKPRIVTDAGETLSFDDPRVRHVLLADTPPATSRLFVSLYSRQGWKAVTTPLTNTRILQAARRVCSGRECLPFLSMMGKAVLYLETRPPDEVTLFHLLEQEGPCQIGNWFDAATLIFRRLGARNAFPVWPRSANNYLGSGEQVALSVGAAGILGDLLGEVRSSVRCLAQDPAAALRTLGEIEHRVITSAERGPLAAEMELRRSARELARIPLRRQVAEAPKVLLFSGINRIFVDRQVREYLEARGILAKTGDIGEFLCLYETEPVVRRGLALGYTNPEEQFSPRALLAGVLRPGGRPRFEAVRAALHVAMLEWLDHRWRAILAPSGLTFGADIHYREVLQVGHRCVSCNGWTEAPMTAGCYVVSLGERTFGRPRREPLTRGAARARSG